MYRFGKAIACQLLFPLRETPLFTVSVLCNFSQLSLKLLVKTGEEESGGPTTILKNDDKKRQLQAALKCKLNKTFPWKKKNLTSFTLFFSLFSGLRCAQVCGIFEFTGLGDS